jgi:hypothetical protein
MSIARQYSVKSGWQALLFGGLPTDHAMAVTLVGMSAFLKTLVLCCPVASAGSSSQSAAGICCNLRRAQGTACNQMLPRNWLEIPGFTAIRSIGSDPMKKLVAFVFDGRMARGFV